VASSRGLRHASRATLVGTRDKHEAEQLLEQVYLPNRVEPLEGGSIDMQLGAIKVGSTTVGRLSYGADARLTTGDALPRQRSGARACCLPHGDRSA
jgi:hypothetical protein